MTTTTEPLIDPKRVRAIILDCLFTDDEMAEGAPVPADAVIVEGIINRYGFHPQRLESHRAEVASMLACLPDEFQQKGGGGWSFLNGCSDRNGNLWTGLQMRVGELLALGIGLGVAAYLLPREMWAALPGSVPYFVVKAAA